MENKNVKLAAPWTIYANKIEAMFKKDPDVYFQYDDESKVITLRVNGTDKADALTQLLPGKQNFGGVTLTLRVIPANDEKTTKTDLFRRAFGGNPIISEFVSVETLWGPLSFVVFKPEVIQYYNDELYDFNGLKTTIYQDLAKELFDVADDGIFFCTEKID